MKKLGVAFVTVALALAAYGCGAQGTDSQAAQEPQQEEAVEQQEEAAEQDAPEDEGENPSFVEVDEGLINVTITVPADFIGEQTQEDLDAMAAENGFKSATLNEDGSATYVMSKAKHREFLEGLAVSFDESLNGMIGSEDYPSITAIEHNDDFTSFTVTVSSDELGFNETFSVLNFYLLGGMYTSFEGEVCDNVHADFVSANSGEVIYSWDSQDMGE